MRHINLTNFIVRYEDGRYNEKDTCDKIDAYLKDLGYKYLKSYFTNSFSYFGNKTPQLRIIIDGAKAGWKGAHTKKFVLVQHDNVFVAKLNELEKAGKEVVDWKNEEEDERIKKGTSRRANIEVGINALEDAIAKMDDFKDHNTVTALYRTIDELRALQNRIY